MENFSLNGITESVILDTRRKKQNDLYPIKYRVTFLRKQVYYNAGIDLSLEEWDRLSTTKNKELRSQREILQIGFDKIKSHIIDLVKSDHGFTLEQLNARLSRGTKNSIISAFLDRVDILRKENRLGTADWYYYTIRNIKEYQQRDLKFSDITVDWLKKYEAHLQGEGKSYTTISMYMRALQAVMNEGKSHGIISGAQFPFGKGRYEIPEAEGRKMALTLAQVGAIMTYPLTSETELRCRDLWFFCYLCNGINITDLLQLKYSNIVGDEIRFYRQKTITRSRKKKEIIAFLLPEMQALIQRWGNPDRSDNYIFPFLSTGLSAIEERRIIKNVTSLINKKMTKIGKALGIGPISTYTARHSFATVQKRSGANISYISESLGHTDIKTTENYLASFEREERLKNASYLTKFE
jgi:integrase